MMTALYKLFQDHNITPDEFYAKSLACQGMILAFEDYETDRIVEEKERREKEARRRNAMKRRGGR